MIRRIIRIENELGLHARAAARLVQIASRFDSQVTLATLAKRKETDGKSILGVMLLAARCGTELEVTVDGADEEAAMAEIVMLAERNFNESK